MDNSTKKTIVITMLYIALILLILSQFFPWMSINKKSNCYYTTGISENPIYDKYSWGEYRNAEYYEEIKNEDGTIEWLNSTRVIDRWQIFGVIIFDNSIGTHDESFLFDENMLLTLGASIVGLFFYIFLTIAIFSSLKALKKSVKLEKSNYSLKAGIFSTFSIILFVSVQNAIYLGAEQAYGYTQGEILNSFNYNIGFYSMIIATILFFIAYIFEIKTWPDKYVPKIDKKSFLKSIFNKEKQ